MTRPTVLTADRTSALQECPPQRNCGGGSYTYTDEFGGAIDLLATGLLVVDDLASVVAPLLDTLAAFDDLQAGRIMKALIAPNG